MPVTRSEARLGPEKHLVILRNVHPRTIQQRIEAQRNALAHTGEPGNQRNAPPPTGQPVTRRNAPPPSTEQPKRVRFDNPQNVQPEVVTIDDDDAPSEVERNPRAEVLNAPVERNPRAEVLNAPPAPNPPRVHWTTEPQVLQPAMFFPPVSAVFPNPLPTNEVQTFPPVRDEFAEYRALVAVEFAELRERLRKNELNVMQLTSRIRMLEYKVNELNYKLMWQNMPGH